VIGEEGWITDPNYATPKARLPHLKSIFARIEEWTMTKTKFEAMDILNEFDIPCGPILSMKEIAEEPSLRATGTIVEVDHPARGKYLTVGNPIKMSDSATEVTRSPLLGDTPDEVMGQLGYSAADIARCAKQGHLRSTNGRPRLPQTTVSPSRTQEEQHGQEQGTPDSRCRRAPGRIR
jgi:formyl-CoA transferase